MKKSSIHSLFALLALLLTLSSIFTGCGEKGSTLGSTAASPTANAAKLSGKVTVSGSTSIQPLSQALADEFTLANSGVIIDIQAGGSSTGVKNAHEGVTDIGSASRELKEEEKSWGLTTHKIALDGIAIVVHPSNKVEGLTQEQIIKIFTGEITNWKDVGGIDKAIVIVSREEGSGTRGAFEEILKIEGKIKENALICNENGVVKATVSSKENAIGYMSIGYVDGTAKAIKVDDVECTVENIKSATYKISRPFVMLTKGVLKPEVQAFLDFILSDEGQRIVAEEGYIPVK